MEGKKLFELLCVLWSVFCLTVCVRRNDTRRWRRELCPEGTYTTSNKLECCLCPKGFYLMNDCTVSLTDPKCESCESGTYRDHANSEKNCELCKTCGIDDNMVVGPRCTPSSNTVCRCEDGFYCDKGDECRVCYSCSTCDEFGVKVPCSRTNDTQCNEGTHASHKASIAIICTIIGIIGIIGLLITVFLLWKKKLLCFKPKLDELEDLDLHPMLARISELLGWRTVLKVVRHKALLSDTEIQNIIDEYPHDVSEQTYQLLNAWYEIHGMKEASNTLCNTLIKINKRRKAKWLHSLIKKELHKGEVENNGPV